MLRGSGARGRAALPPDPKHVPRATCTTPAPHATPASSSFAVTPQVLSGIASADSVTEPPNAAAAAAARSLAPAPAFSLAVVVFWFLFLFVFFGKREVEKKRGWSDGAAAVDDEKERERCHALLSRAAAPSLSRLALRIKLGRTLPSRQSRGRATKGARLYGTIEERLSLFSMSFFGRQKIDAAAAVLPFWPVSERFLSWSLFLPSPGE